MKISVAMATYNGMPYIEKQLNSIIHQTRQPDEVIITDDRSTDGTVEFIQRYIASNHLSQWSTSQNENNLGWRENFRKAISKTTGDIVFFADQDDIWKEKKIEVMSYLMEKHNMGCLYGSYQVIDAEGNRKQERDIQNHFSGKVRQIPLSPNFYQINPLGCCMAVSRKVIEKYMKLNLTEDDHDSQCPRIAAVYSTLYELDSPVIYYRLHGHNNSGGSEEYTYGVSNLEDRLMEIRVRRQWLNKVAEDVTLPQKTREMLQSGIQTEFIREAYLTGEKGTLFSIIPRYRNYSNLTQLIGDISYRHDLNKALGKIRWMMEGHHKENKT